MTEETAAETVGELPNGSDGGPAAPGVLTGLVWALWVASLVAVGARVVTGGGWELSGLVVVDGLTVLMWTVVTFFSGIVHSYSRRYMAGSERVTRFFAGLFGFTLAVLVLVAADHVVLFGTAWLAMGLVMAALIGTARGWGQARRAASYTRRYLLAGSALLALALALLATSTDTTAISEITARAGTVPDTTWLVAASALLLAAMVQSALIPFHTWLLSSMTAPTPASALMHAGFVNAGGILLLRFAPVVDRAGAFMLVIVVAGALSALVGKLLKSVRPEVKHQLACSTTGQMGFMILQAGLGFFGAAITHLILHGFYKAYLFLGSGEQVTQTSPTARSENGRTGLVGGLVTLVTALAGGVLFAVLTGKGTSVDSGLLLTGLVALTTLHATQVAVRRQSLPVTLRYGVVAVVFLPAVAVYAGAYQLVTGLLSDVPLVTTPADLTVVHVAVAVAFGVAYVAIEMGVYRRSRRLYVLLVNATQPPTATLLTATEEYNEH
jgi:NAD(P)H-quinone oxidoreductase subunit 5